MRAVAAITLLFALLPGCASRLAQVRVDTPTVTGLRIEGNRAITDNAIRARLAQRTTSVWHWIPPFTFFNPRQYLEGTAWQDDRARIANLYALHGFFDARATSSQILPGKRRNSAGDPLFVKILHSVEEGEPSVVRVVDYTVLAESAAGVTEPADAEKLLAAVRAATPLDAGARFVMDDVDEAKASIEALMASRGRALGAVEAAVDAYPEEHAVDVRFVLVPGPRCVFGDIVVRRLDETPLVRETDIRRRIAAKQGAPWEGDAIRAMQQAIYNMGVFSMVTVTPDRGNAVRRDDGTVVVPVTVALRERKPRSLQFGGGIAWDTQGFGLHVSPTFAHLNLGGRLIRGSAGLSVGYRYLSPADHFPTGALNLDLSWPDFPLRKVTLRAQSAVELGLEKGYKFWTPSIGAGVTWAPLSALRFDAAYSLSYYDVFFARIGPEPTPKPEDPRRCPQAGGVPGACTAQAEAAVEPEFPDNYLLSYFRQAALLDLRGNPLAANKGVMASIAVDEAFPFGTKKDGSLLGFRYVRFEGEFRGFVPLYPDRLVLAFRVSGAHVETWGDAHQIPLKQRIYLGGDGSVRGFKSRYLGPRAIDPLCSRKDCVVPLGARSGVSGSAELRVNPIGPLWLAGFVDAGRAWGDATTDTDVASEELKALEAALYKRGLQWSFGGGIRFGTPVGRVRLDFGIRPDPWPMEATREPYKWNIHFNIGESF